MACKNICTLCKNLIISTYVVWDATNKQIVVGLPAGTYNNGQKYCIVIAQTIPTEATVNAPVVVNIGTSATAYPIANCDCSQLTACGIRTRTRYATRLSTTASGAVFRMLGKAVCCGETAPSITG